MDTKSVLKIKLTKTMKTEGGWKIVYSGEDEGKNKGSDSGERKEGEMLC